MIHGDTCVWNLNVEACRCCLLRRRSPSREFRAGFCLRVLRPHVSAEVGKPRNLGLIGMSADPLAEQQHPQMSRDRDGDVTSRRRHGSDL